GFQSFLIALLADLVAINRTLLEELKLREAPKILRAPSTDATEPSSGGAGVAGAHSVAQSP
ncbi:MAG: hypothetical protein ACRD00_04725, partial [Thermoanaerobaculia bacterium]